MQKQTESQVCEKRSTVLRFDALDYGCGDTVNYLQAVLARRLDAKPGRR